MTEGLEINVTFGVDHYRSRFPSIVNMTRRADHFLVKVVDLSAIVYNRRWESMDLILVNYSRVSGRTVEDLRAWEEIVTFGRNRS